VAPGHRVNASASEAFALYGFGGRQVAWGDNTALKYLLADHLTSSHAEVSTGQSELGQRRNFPFGSDRAVSGASDLSVEERYTGQRRLDAGNGNSKRELYYYGARWYLPGVGVFSQPDVTAVQRRDPQGLNRYAYVINNPVRYTDPMGLQSEDDLEPSQSIQDVVSGQQPNWFDEGWQWEFQAANGRPPEGADYLDRYNSMLVASGMMEAPPAETATAPPEPTAQVDVEPSEAPSTRNVGGGVLLITAGTVIIAGHLVVIGGAILAELALAPETGGASLIPLWHSGEPFVILGPSLAAGGIMIFQGVNLVAGQQIFAPFRVN